MYAKLYKYFQVDKIETFNSIKYTSLIIEVRVIIVSEKRNSICINCTINLKTFYILCNKLSFFFTKIHSFKLLLYVTFGVKHIFYMHILFNICFIYFFDLLNYN